MASIEKRRRTDGQVSVGVDAAGQHWPEGWVKGEGFVRPREDNRYEATPSFAVIGEEYVRQIVELSPGQRKRYLAQIRILADVEIRGVRVFDQSIDAIVERDIKAWLIDWDRALKTMANYHGLLFGVFTYAVEEGYLSTNPCARTAPKRSRVRQSQAELRFLTEDDLKHRRPGRWRGWRLLTFAVGPVCASGRSQRCGAATSTSSTAPCA